VLGAALLHASWNGLIRVGSNKIGTMLVMTLTQAGIGLAIALARPWPSVEVWFWLLASGVLHSAYKLFLTFAYEQGDLSRVYPIARGAAPAIVLVVGLVFLAEPMTRFEVLGIAVLVLGILTMARGVFTSGESLRVLPFAFGSAIATAGYSIVDGLGARVAGDALLFVGWMFFLDAVFFTPTALWLRGRSIWIAPGRARVPAAASATASFAAYPMAVWSLLTTQRPKPVQPTNNSPMTPHGPA